MRERVRERQRETERESERKRERMSDSENCKLHFDGDNFSIEHCSHIPA
jgi:hypothetical protein